MRVTYKPSTMEKKWIGNAIRGCHLLREIGSDSYFKNTKKHAEDTYENSETKGGVLIQVR